MRERLRALAARLAGRGTERLLPRQAVAGPALPLIAAVLALVAALACALALSAQRLGAGWQDELGATATLQVLADEEAVEGQARAALGVLRATPGVRSVRMIDVDEQRALLAPWLGVQATADDLPLPLLIEVSTAPGELDLPALRARLAAEAPGAIYDDHGSWRANLVATAEAVRRAALVGLGLLAAALVAAAALATSAAAAAGAATIDTLRLVGARDGLITAAFVRRVVLRALVGAAAGVAGGLALLAWAASAGEAAFNLAGIAPTGWGWLAPVLVLPAAGVLAWVGAHWALARRLRRPA